MKNKKIILLISSLLLSFAIIILCRNAWNTNDLSENSQHDFQNTSSIDEKYREMEEYKAGYSLKQVQDMAGNDIVASVRGTNIFASQVALEKWRYQQQGEQSPDDDQIIHQLALDAIILSEVEKSNIHISNESQAQIEQLAKENYEKNLDQNRAFAFGRGLTDEEAIQQNIQNDLNLELRFLWREETLENLSNGSLEVPTNEFNQARNDMLDYTDKIKNGTINGDENAITELSEKIGALYDLYLEYLLEQSDFKVY